MRHAGAAEYVKNSGSKKPEDHLGLVRKIVFHMACSLPPQIDRDDLFQAGCIGLIDACSRWTPSGGASFETFAGIRIRGSVNDWLRDGDFLPKSARSDEKKLRSARERTLRDNGHEPTDSELSAKTGVSTKRISQIRDGVAALDTVSVEDLGFENNWDRIGAAGPSYDPERLLSGRQELAITVDAIASLPEKERLVLSLYHEEELNFREIAAILGVTEARVSQIHSSAIKSIRSAIATSIGERI